MFPGKKEPDKIPNFSSYRNAVSLKFSKKFTKNRFNDPFYYLEKNCQVSKCTERWPSSPQVKCLAWTTCRNLEAALCTVEYSGLLYKCLLRWSKSNYLGNGTRKGVLLELRSETMPWKIFEKWKTEKGKKKKIPLVLPMGSWVGCARSGEYFLDPETKASAGKRDSKRREDGVGKVFGWAVMRRMFHSKSMDLLIHSCRMCWKIPR